METIIIIGLVLWNIVQMFKIKDLRQDLETIDSFNEFNTQMFQGVFKSLREEVNDIKSNNQGQHS